MVDSGSRRLGNAIFKQKVCAGVNKTVYLYILGICLSTNKLSIELFAEITHKVKIDNKHVMNKVPGN